MDIICPHCGAEASWKITGRNSYQTSLGSSVSINCPVILGRARKAGGTSDVDCSHLNNAVHEAVQRFRQKYLARSA